MSINRNLAIKLTAKQGGLCGLCGRNLSEVNEVHIDHIVPKSIGGGDTEDNLQAVCAQCNLRKGSTPPLAWSPAHLAGNVSDYDVKSDPFVQRFIDSGVSPFRISHSWQAEGLKRVLANHPNLRKANLDGFPGPLMVKWQTWFWKTDQIQEWLSMPQAQPGVVLALHRDVGIGVHVFAHDLKADPDRGDHGRGFILYPDEETEPLFVLLMVIARDSSGGYLCAGDPAGQPQYVWVPFGGGERRNIAANATALLSQCIVTVDEEKAPRAMRRQASREAGWQPTELDETSVYTVTYRRQIHINADGKEPSGEARDKHWWVSGHFRNQSYPSEGVVRPIFIHPHIQGNPDAPLYVRPRVNVVKR